MSQEHVLPLWLSEHLNVTSLAVSSVMDAASRQWTAKGSFGLTVGAFCKHTCNEGWMSDLEQAVKPILGPLALGQRIEMSPTDQALLAAWVWKTSLTVHATHPRSRTSPDREEYRRFFRDRTPPAHAAVWVGGYHRVGRASQLVTKDAQVLDGAEPVGHTSVFTATVGAVLVQCLRTATLVPNAKITWTLTGTETHCVRIWPPSPGPVMPPQLAIAGDDFTVFAERFS